MAMQIAAISEFLGLRTDTPAAKCTENYSPDCSDLIFTTEGMATRGPFLAATEAFAAQIVWRKEFTCKDGSIQVLALDINGKLYTVSGSIATQIDQVTAGSRVCSVTAYGKEWMSFYLAGQGSDAPRQWDGKNLYRVSQGGPGAPPTVTNLSLPASTIASGSRTSNEITIVTTGAHGLLKGYLATISGTNDFIENLTSIVINNGTLPGIAVVTLPTPHGLVPGVSVEINDVQPITVGGSITAWNRQSGLVTATTATAHNLAAGSTPLVELNTDGFGPVIVLAVLSATVFTFANSGGNGTGVAGSVMMPWPFAGELFTVTAVPTSTTFQFAIDFTNGTWTTGDISFTWNGAFFVESVVSASSFTYRQIGPDATLAAGGTVTPTGQIPAGDHLVCQHFLTKTDFLTAPSPPVRFTASGGQYVQVSNLAIGPPNTIARALSFTGANGSRYFILLVPAQVNGLQVSTSTVIQDNVTTTAVLDFSDISLLAATGIDIPGNNLFQQVMLNLPRGVGWYEDRLYWIGEKNTVVGLLNMNMDGGTLSGLTAPLGWTQTGANGIVQVGIMPALQGTGTISQPATVTAQGNAILQPLLNYSLRMWVNGTVIGTISSVSTGFSSSTAAVSGAGAYGTLNFSLPMPATIPADMVITLTLNGTVRDGQLIYADNPNRNPIARASYVQNPEAYDALTGNTGPNDDNTELRAIFVLQESLHFITERRLYAVQQIGNSEPSSWIPYMISDKCGAFDANSVATGKGWAAWGGPYGAFWYAGMLPNKTSAIIAPTWRTLTGLTNVYDDSDAERVYFGTVGAFGVKGMLVYDYHEIALGGSGKWCPWNRAVNWMCDSSTGPVFVFGQKFYNLGTTPNIQDDDLGMIGGYCTFSAMGLSMFQKIYNYAGLKIAGSGVLTPFLYTSTLAATPSALNGQELSTLIDTVAEWPTLSIRGRLLFLKLGQAGVQYALEQATVLYSDDPNAPISGVR